MPATPPPRALIRAPTRCSRARTSPCPRTWRPWCCKGSPTCRATATISRTRSSATPAAICSTAAPAPMHVRRGRQRRLLRRRCRRRGDSRTPARAPMRCFPASAQSLVRRTWKPWCCRAPATCGQPATRSPTTSSAIPATTRSMAAPAPTCSWAMPATTPSCSMSGKANGDMIVDFAGNGTAAGDFVAVRRLRRAGATFTSIDASPMAGQLQLAVFARDHHVHERRADRCDRLRVRVTTDVDSRNE